MRGRWCAVGAFTLALGCGKSPTDKTEGTSSARLGPTRNLVEEASALPSPAAASTGSTGAWRGSYTSAAASLYIPVDWKDVHWKVKEIASGLGEGAIALQIDPATHRVQGTLEGPLGPATIDGAVWDGKLSGTIVRKDPSDQGFMGTLIGTLGADRAEGTMNVSLGEASAVRSATFTMSPRGASTPPP